MTTLVPVHISTDVCEGRGAHYFMTAGQPFLAIATSHEVQTPMGWAPGRNNTHAFARSVKHRGQMIAQQGHDCGPQIAEHVADLPPYANLVNFCVQPKTSRKIMFGSGKVMACGAQVGLSKGAGIPFFTCSDPIRLPSVTGTTHQQNTVIVGATALDLTVGWVAIAAQMALDTYKFVKLVLTAEKEGGKALAKFVTEKLKTPLMPYLPFQFSEPGVTDLLNSGIGFGRSLTASYETGWRTPIAVTFGQKDAAGEAFGTTLTYDPSTKTPSIKVSATTGGKTIGVNDPDVLRHPYAPKVSTPQSPPQGYVDDPEKGYIRKEGT